MVINNLHDPPNSERFELESRISEDRTLKNDSVIPIAGFTEGQGCRAGINSGFLSSILFPFVPFSDFRDRLWFKISHKVQGSKIRLLIK